MAEAVMGDQQPLPDRRRPLWHWLVLAGSLPPIAGIALAQFAAWTWYGELASHWTLHGVIALLPALVVFGRDPRWGRALIALIALGAAPWLLAAFSPRAQIPQQVAATVKVATANVAYFNPEREEMRRTIEAVDADIIGLQEISGSDQDVMRKYARWPHQVWTSKRNLFKIALLSSRPIVSHAIHDIEGTSLIEALIDAGEAPIRVFVLHPHSPTDPDLVRRRNSELALIAQRLALIPEPLLVLGDFNLTPGSYFWRSFTGHAQVYRPPGRSPASWPSHLGPFGITIDHILSRGLGVEDLCAIRIPGSDHRGMSATVSIPPWTAPAP